MFKRIFTGALVFGLAATAPPPVEAQTNCGLREQVTENLRQTWQETQIGAGLHRADRLIEVWSAETGTFTILLTLPNGISCILLAGTDWVDVSPVVTSGGTSTAY